MRILTKAEFMVNRDDYLQKILDGAVFIYPTDTIYGLGCNALISEAVKKIRKIKQRDKQPFSVIAPSKKWIYDNCAVGADHFKYVEQLPGALTLIFKLINKNAIAKEVNPRLDSLGIRIPSHWFKNIVAALKVPIVTTSANVSADNYMTSIDDLDENIKRQVDFIIYEGEKAGNPSKVINLSEEKIEIIRK